MVRKLPSRDVVIVGFGWTGAIMAQELTNEGLDEITAIVDRARSSDPAI